MRRLIVTADDFGAAVAVNEAVEIAHRDGILTAASLMVAGNAAEDAVERAKRLPTLGVGLHLVLVDGRPILPAGEIPDLVDGSDRFRSNMARAGVAFYFRKKIRAQLAAEIEAQFAAFAATGLALDHVNAHKHFHLHPTIAGLILDIGARYGLRAARAPIEPLGVLRRIEPINLGLAGRIAAPWAQKLGRRFRAAGLTVPTQVFGITWSGHMTAARIAPLIYNLPHGLTELYLHPATDDRFPGHAFGYEYRAELAAVSDRQVLKILADQNITLGRFADFGAQRPMPTPEPGAA